MTQSVPSIPQADNGIQIEQDLISIDDQIETSGIAFSEGLFQIFYYLTNLSSQINLYRY